MLPEQWSTMDKVTADKIKANGMKGDFMSILQRRQPVILFLFECFSRKKIICIEELESV